jgi:hypothetical protein
MHSRARDRAEVEQCVALAGPYFQKVSWGAFLYQGATYDLSHLDEYTFVVKDSRGVDRRIAVTFSDHCFTRKPVAGDDPALAYPASDRQPGYFCFERYQCTLGLVRHIAQAAEGHVWIVEGENFAAVPVVDSAGSRELYGIIFSLDPVKRLPIQLHLRVRSAYLCKGRIPITFGQVRFRHLVALRAAGKWPGRNTSQHRRQLRAP